ncbi:MAG: GntR family transcriptional regulator [Muricomes sp.]
MAIKYKWLTRRLKELIIRNIEKGIQKLPSEQELCQMYKVSRQTVRLSLSLLEEEGLIEKKRGSGSYITGLSGDSARNVIGILISDDSDYIYPGILNDIHTTLSQSGFSSKVFVTNNRTCTEREILLELLEHPLHGIIVEGCKSALPNPNLDLYRKLIKSGCIVLFLHNYYPALDNCLYIKDDNIAGSALLVEHLVKQGHTAIGGIFKTDDLQGLERFQGFMDSMRDSHLPVPDEQIFWFHSRDLDGLQKFHDTEFLKKIVQESLDSCTAMVCYNDMIAYHLIKIIQHTRHAASADMAIAAFDNTYLSSSGALTISTLSHKPHEMGTKAARMMLDKLKGLSVTPQEIPWRFVQKESTAESIRKP